MSEKTKQMGKFNIYFYSLVGLVKVVNHALNMNKVAGDDKEHLTVVGRDRLQLCDGLRSHSLSSSALFPCSESALSLARLGPDCCVLTVSAQHSHLAAGTSFVCTTRLT